MWGEDVQEAWAKIKSQEPDNPSDSDMLRRLISRASGVEIKERKRGSSGPSRWHIEPTEIGKSDLSTRASNALIAAGITTIEQLKQVKDLSRIQGLGPASVWEVKRFLEAEEEDAQTAIQGDV